ncbi:type 2 lanthipeptide synthetase LanM family protein [Streptomyces sparsogenes]|uniref:type 2 lanthipeptide synthetase LanM family protein n=1 Tax=Streptomyces sparsogenes TaxID=67365 RepID=UPI00384C6D7C
MPPSRPPGRHADSLAPDFWAAGCYLRERLTPDSAPPDPADPDPAAARLAGWRALAPFRGPEERFADGLRPVGVTAPTLYRLLGEDPAALAARLPGRPAWADRVRSAPTTPAPPGEEPLPGLLRVAEPLLRQARDRMRTALRDLGPFPAELDGLCDALPASVPVSRLATLLKPTMVLEINVARVEGRLASGRTGEERYRLFVDSLADPGEQHRVWTEYPVLARCVAELLDSWVANRTRFARHLRDDLGALCETVLSGARPRGVAAVNFGQGDVHRDGASVCRVDFHDAPPVFYKPRSLAVDEQFARLLRRFTEDSPYALRTPRTLTRADHGWAECVTARPCASTEDLAGFYWRTGALLALVHALRGTDFHHENIVAAGEHPVLVDLEALLHPGAPKAAGARGGGGAGAAERESAPGRESEPASEPGPEPASEEPALVALRESVRATALLPTKVVLDRAAAGAPAADYSGLNGAKDQPSVVPVPVEKNPGTDEVHIVWEHVSTPGGENRPRLPDGTPADPAGHTADVLAGFRFGYDWISDRRAELLAPGGLVAGFADTPVRFLPRASFVYAKVLAESTHPDFLRDALERERSTARLCGGRYAGPAGEAVVRAEMDAVLRGDIPLFEALPGARKLLLDDGRSVPDFFDEPALAAVRRRIDAMGPEDRAFQERIIAGSFVGGVDVSLLEERPSRAAGRGTPRPRTADADELVAAATAIGDRVRELATAREGRIGWIAPQPVAYGVWDLAPLGEDLYSGLSGIGLFLARLGLVSGQARFTALALDIADEVVRRVHARAAAPARDTGREADIGAFGGWMGPVYFLAHLDRLLGGIPQPAAVRDPALSAVERALDGAKAFDVVAGSAGCALALLALVDAGLDTDGRAAALARRAARHLVAGAVPGGGGRSLAWEHHQIDSGRPLTGFAHGTAGIVTALARLHPLAPDEGCAEAVAGGLAYEAEVFDPGAGNWPDFRTEAPSPYRSLWCHGAAGIGMSRLDLIGRPGTAGREEELAAEALVALRLEGPGAHRLTGRGSDSMCHGDLGNLELVLLAERSGRAEPGGLMRALGEKLDAAAEDGWVCGSPTRSETPGLMTGISGVGHQLLRFAAPDRVPSVLLLHPPAPAPEPPVSRSAGRGASAGSPR